MFLALQTPVQHTYELVNTRGFLYLRCLREVRKAAYPEYNPECRRPQMSLIWFVDHL